MECINWNEEDWGTLIYTIQREKCILMLGPDAATEEVDGQPRPLTEILANELAERLNPELKQYLDPSNLAQVAQYYRMEQGRNDLEAKVCEFYDAKWTVSSELHRDLAVLPFYFTITSTPDNMLCEAFREQGKEPIIEHYNFRGENPSMIQMGSVRNPLVFYLYGMTDEPESLVLTENNLLNFLAAVISKNPSLPNNVLSELRDKNKSLLFLGFGFKHWYLRILLHVLQGHEKESRSFALEQYTPRNLEEFQRTILFFRTTDYKITICEKELHGFVKELRKRHEQRSADKSSKVQLQDAPVVFLCHAIQNRNMAESLGEHLNNAGFKVWFDEDDYKILEEAIKNEIDYVVVLQSQAMRKKFESSFDDVRLRQQKNELRAKWELLSQKLTKLEKDKILETQPDERFRLEDVIAETKAEREHVEQQLTNFETQIPKEPNGRQSQIYLQRVIQLALERQQQEFRGYHFLIPVKIEDCEVLEALKSFTMFDISKHENIKKLISRIKRDQQRRKRR